MRQLQNKNKNLVHSFNNAAKGIIHAIQYERNMKIHLMAAAVVFILSLFYSLTREQFMIVCLTIALVAICELFNTAIEALVDMLVNQYHPKAKVVKDLAAGGVLVSAMVSLVVAYFIFFDRVSNSLETGISRIKQSQINITAMALVFTVITVLVIKAVLQRGLPFSGGMPSGHAAVSFSITTAVALWTGDAGVTVLCIIIAFLVVQSRLEGGIHNVLELVAGASLGFLVTLLMFQLLYSGGAV